jgi:hypothetical protein
MLILFHLRGGVGRDSSGGGGGGRKTPFQGLDNAELHQESSQIMDNANCLPIYTSPLVTNVYYSTRQF